MWLASRKIRSVEKLETLPVGAEPRTSHHRSPGGERHGQSSLKGRGRAIVKQTSIGTISKATLGKLLRHGGGAHMDFSKRTDTILN